MDAKPLNPGQCWIGFDLGGTKMRAVAYGPKFEPLSVERKKTKGNEGAKAGVERIFRAIDKAIEEAGLTRENVAGVGVGCPGPLDLNRGMILQAPNLGWKHVPLKQMLEEEFDRPALVVNDVDAGTFAENHFGSARDARCVLGVFPGTGIGGACVYEGRLLRGRSGSCLEIGHVKVEPDGLRCGCGKNGCLETVASRLAIAGMAAVAAHRGDAPHLLELTRGEIREIRSGALAKSIKAGDVVIERIVRKAASRIGWVVSSVVNLLAPDVVVLGGGLVEAMTELFLEEVEAAIHENAMPAFTERIQVAAAELGDDATSRGAAALVAEYVRQHSASR